MEQQAGGDQKEEKKEENKDENKDKENTGN